MEPASRAAESCYTPPAVRPAHLVWLLLPACSTGRGTSPTSGSPPSTTTDARPSKQRTSGPLSRREAEEYGLALINRDRKAHGLPEVRWDPVAARAAERHVRDMAQKGFTAHWGSDGSTPEHRYTEAGGEDITTENAGCYGDGKTRDITMDGPFDAEAIERFQAAFMNETPPADGHRKNILDKHHTSVGLAFSTSKGSGVVCVAQEFIDDYGTYGALPRKVARGTSVKVTGEVRAPAGFGGVALAVGPMPRPTAVPDLLQTGSYSMHESYVQFYPKGFKTPKPVDVAGNKFSIEVPLGEKGPGLYEVHVYAKLPGEGDLLKPISLRTVVVE